MWLIVLSLLALILGGAILVIKLRPPSKVASTLPESRVLAAQRAVKQQGDDPWNWVSLGLAYEGQGQAGDARKAFEKALSLDQRVWLANFRLGVLLLEDDPDQAEQFLMRASVNAPSTYQASVFLALGDLLYARGNLKGARNAYARGLADMRDIFPLRMGLGRVLQATGKPDEALYQYKQALRLVPGSQEALDAIASAKRGEASPPPLPSATATPVAQP